MTMPPFQEQQNPEQEVKQKNIPQGWALTIAAQGTLTDEVDISGHILVAIQMPAAWTAANVTFLARAYEGAALMDVYDASGNELAVTAAASRLIVLDPSDFAGMRFVQLRSGTTATPVAQEAERAIFLVLRPV